MNLPTLRSPIILVHGLMGFDRVELCGYTLASYFPGIPEFLGSVGNRVYVARVGATAGVAQRAEHLRAFIQQQVGTEPVHILAHSMGGLDARYMISRLGMASQVLSLITIGTPHQGTAFADWGIRRLERLLKPVFDFFGIPAQAFYDLTTAGCKRFNQEVPDAAGVRYFSVAGRHLGSWRSPHWSMIHDIVHRAEGDNDGIVSIQSATYGEDCQTWAGDHLTLINWPHPFDQATGCWEDRAPRYGQLVCRLADLGF